MQNSKLTKNAFLVGAIYFCCMAIAHYTSLKLPILFIYFDTPFYAYQDKIISFAVTAYVALFYAASRSRETALYAIIVLAITTVGLCRVNLSSDLLELLDVEQTTTSYWLQTLAIFGYLCVLIASYLRDRRITTESKKDEGKAD